MDTFRVPNPSSYRPLRTRTAARTAARAAPPSLDQQSSSNSLEITGEQVSKRYVKQSLDIASELNFVRHSSRGSAHILRLFLECPVCTSICSRFLPGFTVLNA